jgi:hypothetical protein
MAKTNMNKTPDSAVEIIDLEGAYPEITMDHVNAYGEPNSTDLKNWYKDIDRKLKIAHGFETMWRAKQRIESCYHVIRSDEERNNQRIHECVANAIAEYEEHLLGAKIALEAVMTIKDIDFKIL